MSTIEHAAPPRDYHADEVLVVDRRDQLRALADNLRATLVALLRDRARSTQELSEELRLPKGTVGHHLKVLERAGLIRVVRTRKVRAVTEKFYGRVAWLFLIRSEEAPETSGLLAAAALRRAADELEVAPAAEGRAAFGVLRVRLTADAARRFERRLQRLTKDLLDAQVDEGEQYVVAAALFKRQQVA
jgi:DNA-binding transcriptional ArsR family regulator